jgi:hypothetical protein
VRVRKECVDEVLGSSQKAQEGYHCSHTSRSEGIAPIYAKCAQACGTLRF